MPLTEALTSGQQLFLQRLLSVHVLTDEEANSLFKELNDTRCESLEESLKIMNAQLSAGFGLEVATVNLHGTRYHAIVNQTGADDAIAKASFAHVYSPHEKAYVRTVLERLSLKETTRSASRMDLINLRNQAANEPFKLISMDAAEYCIDSLLQEHWLEKTLDTSSEATTASQHNRRKSINKQHYQLGPRTYLELSSLLTDFGMPKEDLPQYIFHRM